MVKDPETMGLSGKRVSCYDLASVAGGESPTGTALGAEVKDSKKTRVSTADEKEGGKLHLSYFLNLISSSF